MNKIQMAIVIAALALGSTAISTAALAQRGGHGGGGAHFGGGGARFGGGFRSGGRAFAHRGPIRGFAAPFYFGAPYYDDYACWPYQYNRPGNYAYCY